MPLFSAAAAAREQPQQRWIARRVERVERVRAPHQEELQEHVASQAHPAAAAVLDAADAVDGLREAVLAAAAQRVRVAAVAEAG